MFSDRQVSPIILWPIGILDPDRQAGYFSNTTNGIDAIDLQDGHRLWTTTAAVIPLLVRDDWLIAQIMIPNRFNIIQIAKLKLEGMGQPMWISEPIIFPNWVVVERSPSYCIRPNCSIRVGTDRTHLYLDWQAQNFYQGGAAPPPQLEAYYQQQAGEGRVRLDLDRGEIEMLPPVAQTDLDRKLTGGWRISGQNLVFLTTDYLRAEQVRKLELTICSVDPNCRNERTIELFRAKDFTYHTTVDRRYVLVCSAPYLNERSWSLFNTETGELLHTFDYQFPIDGEMSIFNDKIYLLSKRTTPTPSTQNILIVTDFHTGASLWEYPLVEDPIYVFRP